jgi:branched-chain amino acid transport system permease protein
MYERDEVLIVLATFGLFLVLEDIILIAFGTDPYFAYQPMALLDSVELGGITRDVYGMTLIGVAAIVAVGCWWLLNRTKWGTLLKAVIFDREMGISMGINVPLVYTLTFIGGAILGGLGGAYIAPTISVAPGLGHRGDCAVVCSCCGWWHGINCRRSNWIIDNWASARNCCARVAAS